MADTARDRIDRADHAARALAFALDAEESAGHVTVDQTTHTATALQAFREAVEALDKADD